MIKILIFKKLQSKASKECYENVKHTEEYIYKKGTESMRREEPKYYKGANVIARIT